MVDLSICVLSICISVTRFSIQRLKGLMGFVFVQRRFCFVGSRGHCVQGLKDMRPV